MDTIKFSGTIKIAQVDDFIKPSQDCILPLITGQTKQTKQTFKKQPEKAQQKEGKILLLSEDPSSDLNKIFTEDVPLFKSEFNQNLVENLKKTAKVTLNDCLACAGCVTTAESILLQQQNIDEFEQNVKTKKITIVTMSLQSRASLAVHFHLKEHQIQSLIGQFLKVKYGISHFFDQSFGLEIALKMLSKEIMSKYIENTTKKQNPLLVSECPGWVCYAEKMVGELVFPFMSKVKTPQQIMGNVLKQYFMKTLNIQPEDVYIVSVMPCYDKKLEATKGEFLSSKHNEMEIELELEEETKEDEEEVIEKRSPPKVKEVDTVLTTEELLDIINKHKDFYIMKEKEALLQLLKQKQDNIYELLFKKAYNTENSLIFPGFENISSNGYVDILLQEFKKQYIFSQNIPKELIQSEFEIKTKICRNQDLQEVNLLYKGKSLTTFVRAYGFRNIQNLVRKIKRKRLNKYAFVEIMACPKGCINGAGQIKAKNKENKMETKKITEKTLEILQKEEQEELKVRKQQMKMENPIIDKFLEENEERFYQKFTAVKKEKSMEQFKW